MYKTEFRKTFIKGLKKISHDAQKKVLTKLVPKLQEDPYIGRKFVGEDLKGFFKLAFRHKRNDYRIVYQVKKKEILIVFLAIGSRENFYKRLKRKKI